jgi:hypothetical protein
MVDAGLASVYCLPDFVRRVDIPGDGDRFGKG